MIEESEVDHDQLKCFELRKIEKIKIEVFNWFEKTMMSFCIFNNILFFFIQSLLNMTSWWLISAINIDMINWVSLSQLTEMSEVDQDQLDVRIVSRWYNQWRSELIVLDL